MSTIQLLFALLLILPIKSWSIDAKDVTPAKFKVILETTKGDVTAEFTREWAPLGVDRFYELAKSGFLKDIAAFRVLPGFVAQFGIHGDPKVSSEWKTKTIKDDPVKMSNKRGYITFATSGPNSRTTQLFINFADNARLDGMGFAPIGIIDEAGMKIIDQFFSGYGEGGKAPAQDLIQSQGNTYLKKQFPKLDYIKATKLVIDAAEKTDKKTK